LPDGIYINAVKLIMDGRFTCNELLWSFTTVKQLKLNLETKLKSTQILEYIFPPYTQYKAIQMFLWNYIAVAPL
jgi:hypothetical protein